MNGGNTFLLLIAACTWTFAWTTRSPRHERDAQGQEVVFTAEPTNVEVTCGTSEVSFPCQYTGSTARPQWNINSTSYSSYHGGLPENHSFNGATGVLSVINITPGLNNTQYQCQIQILPSGTVYKSRVGKLVIKCEAPKVHCLPVYHHKEGKLKEIFTNIDQINGSTNLYLITYSDSNTGDICATTFVATSSCRNGICRHVYQTSASLFCSNSSDINIGVTMTNFHRDINFTKSNPIRINGFNKIVRISKIRIGTNFGIKCLFVNKARENGRFCKVSYGCEWTTPGCSNSSAIIESEGASDNHWLIEISMDIEPLGNPSKIYFSVTASAGGTKVIKVEGNFNINATADPDVWCLPYYYYGPHNSTLTEILTTITMNDDYISYVITFSDSESGANCTTSTIPPASCEDGICSHFYEVSSRHSQCSKTANINVTISAISKNSIVAFKSKPLKIDYVNNFIKVSFETKPSIILSFVNQTKANKKFYLIKYGPKIPGCRNLPNQTEGYLSNSNSISLELDLDPKNISEICFSVKVNNATNTVNVEGIYKFEPLDSDRDAILFFHSMVYILVITCIIIIGVGLLLLGFFRTWIRRRRKGQTQEINESNNDNVSINEKEGTPSRSRSNSLSRKICNESKLICDKQPIDKSTTFYELHDVVNGCSMVDFAVQHYPTYQPIDGYGYYEFNLTDKELDSLDPSLSVMFMENNEPTYSIPASVVKVKSGDQTEKGLYIQSKNVHTMLLAGTKFLYCARSKTITVYSKIYPVTEGCREANFVKDNISGFRIEWIQYCYFQLTENINIRPYQRIIVKKKDGEFVTGPGVRHMIMGTDEEDGSKLIKPPDFNKHTEWDCVYIQSRDLDRELSSGTTYLFCVMMDRVSQTVHYDLFDISEACNMVEFAKHRIPGFRPELGYGYYEFKQKELLEPEKNVVLIDENDQLFTGPGAQFFCTGGGYKLEDIKEERAPPSLDGTDWKHIFVQSHSDKRELHPGSKFLYFEYQTN